MSWRIRHQGSPQSIDGLTIEQVNEGLLDGLWQPTDEVMGPDDPDWVALENHPQTAELAADIEPPPRRVHHDESHLDMNALIDVCLVLLIFFILTTTVSALQKRLEAPTAEKGGVVEVTQEKAAETMVHVKAVMRGGEPVLLIGEQEIDPEKLLDEIAKRIGGKKALLLEHDDDVPQSMVIKIIDSAKGAGVNKVLLRVP